MMPNIHPSIMRRISVSVKYDERLIMAIYQSVANNRIAILMRTTERICICFFAARYVSMTRSICAMRVTHAEPMNEYLGITMILPIIFTLATIAFMVSIFA